MPFRAAKNANGVIIAEAKDTHQSGNYPSGSQGDDVLGTWCTWTYSSRPTVTAVDGAEGLPMRFKENLAGDGMELRTDEEVLAAPLG